MEGLKCQVIGYEKKFASCGGMNSDGHQWLLHQPIQHKKLYTYLQPTIHNMRQESSQ